MLLVGSVLLQAPVFSREVKYVERIAGWREGGNMFGEASESPSSRSGQGGVKVRSGTDLLMGPGIIKLTKTTPDLFIYHLLHT